MAQRKTNRRHRDKRKYIRFTEDLKEDAIEWLTEEKLSPELISGRWSVQGTRGVAAEAIYQWIWGGKRRNALSGLLMNYIVAQIFKYSKTSASCVRLMPWLVHRFTVEIAL